jgi:PIN domain nuclease of toxin-antitoxin system
MSSHGYVLDASALLCLFFEESGAERVAALLPGARVSAVNIAEVIAKLADRGIDAERIAEDIAELDLEIVAFDQRQAQTAGLLRDPTRHLALALGVRCCLALARTLGATAVATDRAWLELRGRVAVEIVR